MDYTDMSGPEEDPEDEVEPRPAWLEPSDESSEVSEVDIEKTDMFHVK